MKLTHFTALMFLAVLLQNNNAYSETTPLIVSSKPLNHQSKYTQLGNEFDTEKSIDFIIRDDVKANGKVTEAINGAKLEVNLNLSANQTVKIDYNFLITDHRPYTNDFLMVKILKNSKPITQEQVLFQSASTYNWSSGLKDFQWTADTEGSYTIEITVANGLRRNPDIQLREPSIKDGSMFAPRLVIQDLTVSDN